MATIRKAITTVVLVLFLGVLIGWYGTTNVQAQEQNGWSSVYQLSSPTAAASEGFMAADPFGNVHVFWTEKDLLSNRSLLLQSRFDGKSWSTPIDIYTTGSGASINFIAPFVDRSGTIHLIWSEGSNTYYSRASASATISARSWIQPLSLNTPSHWVRLQVDSSGVFHVVFTIFAGEDSGVYYSRSKDAGSNWTVPLWMDPDIPYGQVPNWLQFGLDDSDGLHVVWNYVNPSDQIGQAIRYTNSLNGGETWSVPLTIDEPDHTGVNLRMAHPGLFISGQDLYVIWGSARSDGTETGRIARRFQISSDAGKSWTSPEYMLGDLVGQAAGAGFAVDTAGRIHYALQVRYPMAIWHTYWDDNRWSTPTIAYLIVRDSTEEQALKETRSRIMAHNVRLAMRNGNQLVMTFTSSPEEGPITLYTMHHTLDDVAPLEPLPIPVPTVTPMPTLSPQFTLGVDPTPMLRRVQLNETTAADINRDLTPGGVVALSLLPGLLLIGGAALFHRFWRKF